MTDLVQAEGSQKIHARLKRTRQSNIAKDLTEAVELNGKNGF